MGKGDIRTRRGKIWRGTCGVTRPCRKKKATIHPTVKARKIKTLKDIREAINQPERKAQLPSAIETIKQKISETQTRTADVQQSIAESAAPEITTLIEQPIVSESSVKKESVREASVQELVINDARVEALVVTAETTTKGKKTKAENKHAVKKEVKTKKTVAKKNPAKKKK